MRFCTMRSKKKSSSKDESLSVEYTIGSATYSAESIHQISQDIKSAPVLTSIILDSAHQKEYPNDFTPLVEAVQSLSSLRRLTLSGVKLEKDLSAIKAVTNIIRTNTNILELTLRSNELGRGPALGAKYLADALRINTSITKLIIQYNDLLKNKAKGLRYILQGVAKNRALYRLDLDELRESKLDPETANFLVATLKDNYCIISFGKHNKFLTEPERAYLKRNRSLCDQLHQAILSDNLDEVNSLLKKGVGLMSPFGPNSNTALHSAISSRSKRMVDRIINEMKTLELPFHAQNRTWTAYRWTHHSERHDKGWAEFLSDFAMSLPFAGASIVKDAAIMLWDTFPENKMSQRFPDYAKIEDSRQPIPELPWSKHRKESYIEDYILETSEIDIEYDENGEEIKFLKEPSFSNEERQELREILGGNPLKHIQEIKDENGQLKNKLERVRQKNKYLKGKLNGVNHNIKNLNEEYKNTQGEIKDIHEDMEEMKGFEKNFMESLTALETDMDEREEFIMKKLTKVTKMAKDLSKKINEVEAELENSKRELRLSAAHNKHNTTNLKKKIEQLNHDLTDLKNKKTAEDLTNEAENAFANASNQNLLIFFRAILIDLENLLDGLHKLSTNLFKKDVPTSGLDKVKYAGKFLDIFAAMGGSFAKQILNAGVNAAKKFKNVRYDNIVESIAKKYTSSESKLIAVKFAIWITQRYQNQLLQIPLEIIQGILDQSKRAALKESKQFPIQEISNYVLDLISAAIFDQTLIDEKELKLTAAHFIQVILHEHKGLEKAEYKFNSLIHRGYITTTKGKPWYIPHIFLKPAIQTAEPVEYFCRKTQEAHDNVSLYGYCIGSRQEGLKRHPIPNDVHHTAGSTKTPIIVDKNLLGVQVNPTNMNNSNNANSNMNGTSKHQKSKSWSSYEFATLFGERKQVNDLKVDTSKTMRNSANI